MNQTEIITLWYLAACSTCDATGTFRDPAHRDAWGHKHVDAHGVTHRILAQTGTTRTWAAA